MTTTSRALSSAHATAAAPRWNRGAMRLLATGLFVAIAGSAMLTAEAAPGPGHHGGFGGPFGGPRAEKMYEAIGASAEQRTQIRQIMEAARTDLKAQHEAGRALRQQQAQLFTQPTVDANAAEVLRQQQLAQHDQASKRMMQAMLEISRVLSPEQRSKLAQLRAEHAERGDRRGPASR